MPNIIGVKFRDAGKVYFFEPGENTVRYHDHVIVETARGLEYGTVVLSPTMMPEEKVMQPLKSVIRMATPEDDEREAENRRKEKEAYRICKQKIAEHELDMKLIEAEYTFDNSKILFYFTADGRIDFRDLVKDLAGIFRTRIELRQIGVRDETKLLGGIGSCGRPLCCHTWLNEFAPVSIKMAKDQNLSLNPTKISGTCGRLMCCLKNEADTYASLNKGLPAKGDYVTTPEGLHGDVQSVNILRQTVKVIVELENDEKELREFEVKDITFIPKAKRQKMLQEMKFENAKENASGRKDEKLPKEPEEDKDLEWNPNMENFDAGNYIINEDGGKGRKNRDKKKRGAKEDGGKRDRQGARAQGGNAEAAGTKSSGREIEETGSEMAEAGQGKKPKKQRKGAHGQGKPQGEAGNRAGGKFQGEAGNRAGGKSQGEAGNRAGGKSQADAAAHAGGHQTAEGQGTPAGGEDAAAKTRKRRRRPHHGRGQERPDGAGMDNLPEEMRNKDHYGTGEGE